jgi:hypothetical protein
MLQWLGGKKNVFYIRFQEILANQSYRRGKKDSSELSQWQLRILNEVNVLSSPFCSLNRPILPQTSLCNWHIFFLTVSSTSIWRKYIPPKKIEEVSLHGRWNKPHTHTHTLCGVKTPQNEQHLEQLVHEPI